MNKKKLLLSIIIFFGFMITAFSQNATADSAKKRHEEMMKILMTKPKYPVKTIGILIYDGYNTLDAIGPYQVLSQLMGVKVMMIAKQKGMVRNQTGLKVQVDQSIDDIKKLDILVIPGGAVETHKMTKDTVVLDWIRAIDKTTTYTTSVCTGAWILGAAGLLKDKNVTTNWYRAEEIMTGYGAHFKQERWVSDGKYWTSAGVTAGLDMSLAIINDLMGEKYTQGVMLDLEYDPHPPYNAGSVKKTDPLVADMMKEMYDMQMLPLIRKKSK
jgi:transcriptional regulator GlxA family with amidase domain